MTPERMAELRRWADSDLTEALDEIERLEQAARVGITGLDRRDARIAELERELADTRKANEILEAQAVAALGPVRFGPGPEVVDAAEDEALKRRRGRRK